MWIVLVVLLLAVLVWAGQFATPAQKAESRKRSHRVAFWMWLLVGPITIWIAWDEGGWIWGLLALGVVGFVLVDCRRKGWTRVE